MSRPLDALEEAIGSRIFVTLKNGDRIAGELEAFDPHLNLWLQDAEKNNNDKTTKLGTIIIRGDNVLFASPE